MEEEEANEMEEEEEEVAIFFQKKTRFGNKPITELCHCSFDSLFRRTTTSQPICRRWPASSASLVSGTTQGIGKRALSTSSSIQVQIK